MRDAAVAAALATERVIDITTTGRRTGEPRRIEIWFHRVGDRFFVTGTPGRARSWYANLVAHPAFTFHLKGSVVVDLPAVARPVTARQEREDVLSAILASIPEFVGGPGQDAAAWIADSPLVEVVFPD